MTDLFLDKEGDLVKTNGHYLTPEAMCFEDEQGQPGIDIDAVTLANKFIDECIEYRGRYECIGYLADFVKKEHSDKFAAVIEDMKLMVLNFDVTRDKYEQLDKIYTLLMIDIVPVHDKASDEIGHAIYSARQKIDTLDEQEKIKDLYNILHNQLDRIIPNGKE